MEVSLRGAGGRRIGWGVDWRRGVGEDADRAEEWLGRFLSWLGLAGCGVDCPVCEHVGKGGLAGGEVSGEECEHGRWLRRVGSRECCAVPAGCLHVCGEEGS